MLIFLKVQIFLEKVCEKKIITHRDTHNKAILNTMSLMRLEPRNLMPVRGQAVLIFFFFQKKFHFTLEYRTLFIFFSIDLVASFFEKYCILIIILYSV